MSNVSVHFLIQLKPEEGVNVGITLSMIIENAGLSGGTSYYWYRLSRTAKPMN